MHGKFESWKYPFQIYITSGILSLKQSATEWKDETWALKSRRCLLRLQFFCLLNRFSRPTPTPHIFTRFLFQISNAVPCRGFPWESRGFCGIATSRHLRHFDNWQLASHRPKLGPADVFFFFSAGDRCLIWLDRNVWLMWIVRQNSQNAAMQLNDWCPTCTLHSCVTSCISNGLSSIEIVTVCDVQCPFCKLSIVTVESWMFTNHLAIKLESFHKLIFPGHWFPWVQNNYNYILYMFIYIYIIIYQYSSSSNKLPLQLFCFLRITKVISKILVALPVHASANALAHGTRSATLPGFGPPSQPIVGIPWNKYSYLGVSLEVGYLCMYIYIYIYARTHKYRLI